MRFFTQFLLICFLLLSASGFIEFSSAFWFSLTAQDKRCFKEEVPSESDITISVLAKEGYGQFVDTVLTLRPEGVGEESEDEKVMLWKESSISKGKYTQKIVTGGELELCVSSRIAPGIKIPADASRVVEMDFIIGSSPLALGKVATHEKLRPVQIQLLQLESTVRDVLTEYLFYKNRELDMRSSSEKMNSRIFWSSVTVISIFVVFSFVEMKQLERYLRRKRMID